MSLCHIGKTTLLKLIKKIDELQSSYGVPPTLRSNLSEDNVTPEFASLWENVLSFNHKILKVDNMKPDYMQRNSKPVKQKYVHSSIIMEF